MEIKKVNGGHEGPPPSPPGQTKRQSPPLEPPAQQLPGQPPVPPPLQVSPTSVTQISNTYTISTTYNNRRYTTINFQEIDVVKLLETLKKERRTFLYLFTIFSLQQQRPFWAITSSYPFWGSPKPWLFQDSSYSDTRAYLLDLFA